ncbi:MAG: formate dehydrogenase subunit gamma [Hyphomicrobiales bacterium]|nr:formate dehydrogenase subunit gamma [Hyphomicrobiales bacterium]
MSSPRSLINTIAAALVIAFAWTISPAAAQNNNFNPTAQAVNEDQLLNALKSGDRLSGRVSIPDPKSASLIQPAGQEWRAFHQNKLPLIGGVAILGMLAALVLFYLVRGRIRVDSGMSGVTITRFAGIDRFVHWLTAGCFIILALSGLNVSFGRMVIMPLFGPEAFASLAAYGKLAHNYLAFPFMLGLALMFLIWVKDNIPGKIDLDWIKAGGGLFSKGAHPPAKRFNAGQKVVFWIVIVGGVAMSVSGWFLLFPYLPAAGVSALQFWTTIHAVLAVLFVAAMLAHAYIGSVGMEGAFDAMGSGEVDLNWAKEHHALWVEEEKARGRAPATPPHAMPAE